MMGIQVFFLSFGTAKTTGILVSFIDLIPELFPDFFLLAIG
jgi:hypothetical protein